MSVADRSIYRLKMPVFEVSATFMHWRSCFMEICTLHTQRLRLLGRVTLENLSRSVSGNQPAFGGDVDFADAKEAFRQYL